MKEWKMAYREKFSENLKTLIEANGESIPNIAADGNIESKAIYRILANENDPQITTVFSIAKGLGLHPKELFDFSFDPTENNTDK